MHITRVADKIPARLSQLVYLDAFVPESGQSNVDQVSSTPDSPSKEPVLPDNWYIPAPESEDWLGITDPEDVKWVKARLTPITWKGLHKPPPFKTTGTAYIGGTKNGTINRITKCCPSLI